GPNGRLNALGREAVLLRWPALLARVGVPARIEEPPPLRPHRWRARSSGARLPVPPSKCAYLLTWPQKGGVAYAPTSDFPLLGIAAVYTAASLAAPVRSGRGSLWAQRCS